MINCYYGIGGLQNICAIGDPRKDAPSNNQINYLTYIFNRQAQRHNQLPAKCGRRGFTPAARTEPIERRGISKSDASANCAFGITAQR